MLPAIASLDDMGRNARQIKPRFAWHNDILVCCLGVLSIVFRIRLRVLTLYLTVSTLGQHDMAFQPYTPWLAGHGRLLSRMCEAIRQQRLWRRFNCKCFSLVTVPFNYNVSPVVRHKETMLT